MKNLFSISLKRIGNTELYPFHSSKAFPRNCKTRLDEFFSILFQISYNGGLFTNKSTRHVITHRTKEWESIDNTLAVVLPYFYDLVFPPRTCRQKCSGCGIYYRQLHVTDVEFLKNFKNIKLSQSFVVTWYNARKMPEETVSCFILNIVFQQRYFATTSNIAVLTDEFSLKAASGKYKAHQILKTCSSCLIFCKRVQSTVSPRKT